MVLRRFSVVLNLRGFSGDSQEVLRGSQEVAERFSGVSQMVLRRY